MNISAKGIALIKQFEGLMLKAYKDSAGVWTIGYGSTRYADNKPVKKGDVLVNEACANDLLLVTLKDRVNTVNSLVKVALSQSQFDALVSFQYNIGALAKSTLLKKLNAGDYAGAADQFGLWVNITNPKTRKKEKLDALIKRRAKEQQLFKTK